MTKFHPQESKSITAEHLIQQQKSENKRSGASTTASTTKSSRKQRQPKSSKIKQPDLKKQKFTDACSKIFEITEPTNFNNPSFHFPKGLTKFFIVSLLLLKKLIY